MPRYRIETTSAFDRAFDRLPRGIQPRITARIDRLADDPRAPGCEKLAGQDLYRVRVGTYRIVYQIQDAILVVVLAKVGHRREVYR
ncbi:MAG: type II toxin-antitoxin system RelE/ParE family toxin [Gemmatimonadales bacterium]|nr:type II toxin-antitoxin system RelE/ParE family toxin [Gemmatimonadales bacterium]